MIKAILAIAFLLIFAAIASAQQLPDDSGRYHLVVVTSPVPTAGDQSLVSQTETHPQLSKIRQSCKSFVFKADDPLYRSRYAATLGDTDLPKIALVRSDGGVLYKASGSAMPDTDTLAADLLAAGRADRAQHPRVSTSREYNAADCPTCPNQPQPQPSRTPLFTPGSRPHLIPDTVNVNNSVTVPQSVYFAAALIGFLIIGGVSLVVVIGLGIGITILVRSFS